MARRAFVDRTIAGFVLLVAILSMGQNCGAKKTLDCDEGYQPCNGAADSCCRTDCPNTNEDKLVCCPEGQFPCSFDSSVCCVGDTDVNACNGGGHPCTGDPTHCCAE